MYDRRVAIKAPSSNYFMDHISVNSNVLRILTKKPREHCRVNNTYIHTRRYKVQNEGSIRWIISKLQWFNSRAYNFGYF